MSAPTIYRSTDASAPVLTGTAGDLIALLDACLCNGYGSKPAAGWTKAFTGTNKAAYRQGASAPLRYYLDVDDSASGAGLAKEAIMHLYETMTAVGVGTNNPNTTSNNDVCRKSATADSTARTWFLIADDTTFYLFVATGDIASTYFTFGFGEYYSYVAGDVYRCFIQSRARNSATQSVGGLGALTGSVNPVPTNLSSFSTARPFTGVGMPSVCARTVPHQCGAAATGTMGWTAANGWPYPDPVDGGLVLCPIFVWDQPSGGNLGVHGQMRGLYDSPHSSQNFNDGDTFDGVGDYAGRSFMVVKQIDSFSSITYVGVIVETTAWDRSS